MRSLCLLNTGTSSSTQTWQILKMKGLQCKRIVLRRLHKYKNVIRHNGYSLPVSELDYLFAHAFADPLSGDAFSLCTLKFNHLNCESANKVSTTPS